MSETRQWVDQRSELTSELNAKINQIRELRTKEGRSIKPLCKRLGVDHELVLKYAKAEGWLRTNVTPPDSKRGRKLRQANAVKEAFAQAGSSIPEALRELIFQFADEIKNGQARLGTKGSMASALATLAKVQHLLESEGAGDRIEKVGAVAMPTEFYKACTHLRMLAVIERTFPDLAEQMHKMIVGGYEKARIEREKEFMAWADEMQLTGDPCLTDVGEGGVPEEGGDDGRTAVGGQGGQ